MHHPTDRMTHTTAFVTSVVEHWLEREKTRKEGNVLFNDAHNTFYLRLYGVRHMVKDHSDSERGTRCRHMGYSFRLAARVLLYAHTKAFVTPVVEHWLERELSQWVHSMKDRSDDPSHHEGTLLPRSYISLREMFHLNTHSKHFISCYMAS